MRKFLNVFLILLLVFGCISGCKKEVSDQVVLKSYNTKTAYSLTEKESNIILDILENAEWEKGTTDCLNDIRIDVKGQYFSYHISCGTFNDLTNDLDFTLSNEDKHTMNQILSNYMEINESNIVSIVDKTKLEPSITYNNALELICEDDMYKYYFYNMISQYVIVTYEDGTSEDILTAFENGRATLDDLDHYRISYYAESKLPKLMVIGSDHTIEAMQAGYSWTFKRDGELSTAMVTEAKHPLLVHKPYPRLYLYDQTSVHTYLLFDQLPDKVSVQYYSTLHTSIDNSIQPEGKFEIDISSPNDAGAIYIELFDGDYVYDITATWNDRDEYEGMIHYYFVTSYEG